MDKNTDIKVLMGKNIASARKKLGYSQEKFAELISISSSTLSKIETGLNMPKPATLTKIVLKLGLELHELFIDYNETLKTPPKKDTYSKLLAIAKRGKDNKYFIEALYQYALLLVECNKNEKLHHY